MTEPTHEAAHSENDPRIEALREAGLFLKGKLDNPSDSFPYGPFIGVYSTGSLPKLLAALKSIPEGIVPVLRIEEPMPFYRTPEIDPLTGKVESGDELSVAVLRGEFPTGQGFTELPVNKQAELLARFKALYDPNVDPASELPYVYATDVRGRAGDYPLTKTDDAERQKTSLLAIQAAGVIEGAIGIAVGKITHGETPGIERARDWNDIVTASMQIRIHIDMPDGQIERYIGEHQADIRQSGLVVDVLKPPAQQWVKRLELDNGGSFEQVSFEAIKETIGGYPRALLLELLKKRYPGGNFTGDQLVNALSRAKLHIDTLYYNATGQLPTDV